MIDFEKYINSNFMPLDVIGTTNFSPIAKAIWRYTWGSKLPFLSWFTSYKKRSMLPTHTAITCVGKDGRPWLMEMDMTKCRVRYISEEMQNILTSEEYDLVKHSLGGMFVKKYVFSGITKSSPEKYYTKNIKQAHVCNIQRSMILDRIQMGKGNEWLFEKYREGVPYDFNDIIALSGLSKKIKILGSSNIFVCSELVQRCYESIGVLPRNGIPMTPKDWCNNKLMKEVRV